jgi:small subunit ribosomal protein S16
MLVIRMQRTGRKGHAQFRVVVQDSRRTPSSGKVVAALGSYDPHAKTTTLNKEKAATYLNNGAQPSDRVIRLLQAEGVDLPNWVIVPGTKSRTVRNTDKRRSTTKAPQPEEVPEPPVVETATEEVPEEPVAEDVTVEESPAEAEESTPEATEEAKESDADSPKA